MDRDQEATSTLFLCLHRFSNDPSDGRAKEQLLASVSARIDSLASQMLRANLRVQRWDQTEDIAQVAKLKLWRALDEVKITDKSHLLRLVALQIRRTIIERHRKYSGPDGFAANHQSKLLKQSVSVDTNRIPLDYADAVNVGYESIEIHDLIERLPELERETFDLLYYNGLTQAEAAQILGITERTVCRRWRQARLALADLLAE